MREEGSDILKLKRGTEISGYGVRDRGFLWLKGGKGVLELEDA